MHLIRRAAFRAASSTASISRSRSVSSSAPFAVRSKGAQRALTPSVFRRFNSDEASIEKRSVEDAEGEQPSVQSAIDSAKESATNYASEAAESVRESYEQAKESVADVASAAAGAVGYRNQLSGGFERPEQNGLAHAPQGRLYVTPNRSVYIGNLLFDLTASDLQREFEQFGKVLSATIATDGRGLSKGYGYVEFETIEQADAAIAARHQMVFEGRRIVVNYKNQTRTDFFGSNPPSKTLFIGNLAFEMSDTDLNKLFREIRNVIDVRVAIDRRTGQPRGFAHADFVDIDSATKAKEVLAGKEIYGRKIRVDFSGGSKERRGDGGERGPGSYQERVDNRPSF